MVDARRPAMAKYGKKGDFLFMKIYILTMTLVKGSGDSRAIKA